MTQSSRTPKIVQIYTAPSFNKIDVTGNCLVRTMPARGHDQSATVKCFTDRKCDSCFDIYPEAGILFIKQIVINPDEQGRDTIVLCLPKNIATNFDLKGDFARLLSRTGAETDATLDSTRGGNMIVAPNLTLRLYNSQAHVLLQRAGSLNLSYVCSNAPVKKFFSAVFEKAPLSVLVNGDKSPALIRTQHSFKSPYLGNVIEPAEVIGINLAEINKRKLSRLAVMRR